MHRRALLSLALPLLTSIAACQDAGTDGDGCGEGTIEQNGTCVPAAATVRLTHLDVRYDLSQPVFVNNRVPITFGVTGENLDPANAEPRQVAVGFSFVEADPSDPENPLICGSSSVNVELPGDGSEVIVDAFIWPTTLCAQLAGEGKLVNLQVDFDGGAELADELVSDLDAPSVTFSPALAGEPLNQLCRSSLEGDAGLGCAYEIEIRPTPAGASGSAIDVRYGLTADSSVAIVPFQQTENIGANGPADPSASLIVQSRFVVNGRDPYFSAIDPSQIPAELIDAVPTIEEDLQFGLDPAGLAALSTLPGTATVAYTLRAASDPDTELPLSIRDPQNSAARLAEAPVERVVPGVANDVAHELFLEGAALEAVSPGGVWANESDFVVRGCFVADFPQDGNAGDEGLEDCRDLEIVLVHEEAPSAGASAITFNKSFERKLGNDRIGIETSMETQNRLDFSGASSHSAGGVYLEGKIGKSFDLALADAHADANLNVDPTKTSYDIGVEAFGQTVFSASEEAAKIVRSDDFSVAKSFTIGQLGFGFGPISIGISVSVGGTLGITTEDTLEALTDAESCQLLLASADTIVLCGRMTRIVSPFIGMTGKIFGGINLKLVKAGVSADLRFVTTSFPLEATLGWGLTDDERLLVRGDVNWDLELEPIGGDVSIVGKVGFRRFAKTLKVNLFSFSSPTITTKLLSESMAVSEELL
ncbi:MAG: hypothetical protein KC431_20120 [Myxococcales bacterium]|nr:hypothetical protein [Myxococcales bacterium]